MSVTVKINERTFSVHDRFQDVIASVAVGDTFSIWDGPSDDDGNGDGKRVEVTSVTHHINDNLTVSQFTFQGTDVKDQATDDIRKDVNDEAVLYKLGSVFNRTVIDTLSYTYSYLPLGTRLEFENATYQLSYRNINIVNYNAPLGSGLSSRLYFNKR